MGTLQGSRVIVTAGGSGIGLAIARGCAQAGALVHIGDLRIPDQQSLDPGITAATMDAGNSRDVAKFFHEALAALGPIDVLVNNVGIAGPTAAAQDITEEEWRQTLDVNLTSHFLCAQHVIPAFRERKRGCIINISSVSAYTNLPFRLPYVVSKLGVIGLTKALARELGPDGIRVNAILPGWVNNLRGRRVVERKAEEMGTSFEALAAESLRYISMRSMIDESEIADLVVFLASESARHITGQEIGVDAGFEYEL
jgi:NAD(P)-dependent dehydrogenase (short-subunit alcohol dehydrogenase family)